MGLWDLLFGGRTPEARLERARALYGRGKIAEARLDALELLDTPGAAELVAAAESSLALANLETAVSWAEAGDAERVGHHMEVAQSFRQPGQEEAFASARERIDGHARKRDTAAAARARQEAARLSEVHDGFREATGTLGIDLPEGASEEEAEALEARLTMLHDAYPEALRDQMIELGSPFAQAVLDLEDGLVEQGLQALLALPDDSALVQHERARAARRLGDPAAAARAWQRFAELSGGHTTVGGGHTAVMLAEAQAAAGDPETGLKTLAVLRRTEPDVAAPLHAALLEATGRLPEAESAYRALLSRHGPQPSIYLGIARVRLAGGHRDQAMAALETCMSQNPCDTGRCGSRPPDLATHRLLATLYLEDGKDLDRGLELADIAVGLVDRPTWEDAYLVALVGRARADGDWPERASHLGEVLPADDPRQARVAALLGPLAS